MKRMMLVAAAVLCLGGCFFRLMGIPEHSREVYDSSTTQAVADVKTRLGAVSKRTSVGRVLIAPVIFEYDEENLMKGLKPGDRILYPPVWQRTIEWQNLAEQLGNDMTAGLQKRGFVDTTPGALKASGFDVASLGHKYSAQGGVTEHNDKHLPLAGLYNIGGRLNQWTQADFQKVHSSYANTGTAIFVRMRAVMEFHHYSKQDNEAILNWETRLWPELTVCVDGDTTCSEIKLDAPIRTILAEPSRAYADLQKRNKLSQYLMEHDAGLMADVALAMLDASLERGKQ